MLWINLTIWVNTITQLIPRFVSISVQRNYLSCQGKDLLQHEGNADFGYLLCNKFWIFLKMLLVYLNLSPKIVALKNRLPYLKGIFRWKRHHSKVNGPQSMEISYIFYFFICLTFPLTQDKLPSALNNSPRPQIWRSWSLYLRLLAL